MDISITSGPFRILSMERSDIVCKEIEKIMIENYIYKISAIDHDIYQNKGIK